MIHRDPSRYTPTTHFRQQCKYRTAPKPSNAIAAECIREGELRPASDVTDDARPEHVIFEHDRAGTCWRVVAEIRPEPYVDPDATHPLITIYAKMARYHDGGFPTR